MRSFLMIFLVPALFISLSTLLISESLNIQTYEKVPRNLIKSNCEEPLEETQGTADNPYEASEFRYKMLSSTKDSKDKFVDLAGLRRNAIEYAKENLDNHPELLTPTWTAIGPGNIGGRIRSILIKPAAVSTILIGSVSGGIWKSTNSGLNWTAKLDDKDPIAIGSMVFDPKHPDTVFAGTGEGWGNFDAVYGGGIYRSTDFGDTWTLLAATISSSFRNVLKMTADTAGNIYAATKNINTKQGGGEYTLAGGLFRSTNSGTTWTKISSSTFADNYFNPCDVLAFTPSEILFAVNSNGATLGGIYRTTNSGTNWTKITTGLPSSAYKRISLAQDPSHKDTLYSVFESTDVSSGGDGGLKGIFMSADRGVTWTSVTTPPKISSTGTKSYLSSQGWYDNTITVDPHSSANIYVAGVDMMKSTNRGTSWSQLTYWHSFYGSPVVHADHHVTAYDPITADVIYEGNDGGIFKTTNGGTTWTSLNSGLEITQYFGGSVYKTGSTVVYGGTQDNGHLKFSTGTDWTMVFGGDGGYTAQDQTDALINYEEYVYLDMSKTTDGGSSWASCTSGLTDATSSASCLFISPFSMNQDISSVLIAGSDKTWITSNGGTSWTASSGTLSAGEFVSAVTVDGPSSPYYGYAGTTGGKIFRCTSLDPAAGLDTWTDISPVSHNGAWVRRIVVNSVDSTKLLACYSGFNISAPLLSKHIWYSTNSGTSWTDISNDLPNIPVHSALFNPYDPTMFILSTETGIFRSTNSGTNWSLISSSGGMPSYVPVDEIVLQSGTGSIFAFTHGRSVFYSVDLLPVELASFTSSVNLRDVTLNWATVTEDHNSGFDIERSSSRNSDWIKIGFVQGFGNSGISRRYTFTDHNLNTGKYYYRLKQIDFNGNFKYYDLSVSVNIGIPNIFSISQNYPNPFNPSTKIDYDLPVDSKVSIMIYDMTGRESATLVNEIQTAGYHTVEFNGSDLASGIYFYRINISGDNQIFSKTLKMMLIK
ncbi:hypothetical protein BH10BAC5_BH10BAC5_27890 [soil metagenome]